MTSPPVYIIAHQVLTPLASGTVANLDAIAEGKTAVIENRHQLFQDQGICGSLFSAEQWLALKAPLGNNFTDFETLLLQSINEAVSQSGVDLSENNSVLIIASTKGNIGELKQGGIDAAELAGLHYSAVKLAGVLKYHSRPLIVSNACISGMTALLVAKRLLQAGHFKHAVVAGADCISPFILAGFKSFQALSPAVCRPFDKDRNGLNLGEGAATIVLSTQPAESATMILSGGSTSNDANHISGPSRTGAEMAHAIRESMRQAGVLADKIGFISAHGTATPYNDEMESNAFLAAELSGVPAFSLKASFGHTLGAAGLIESAVSIEAMNRGWILPSRGYSNHGVTVPVTIAKELSKNQSLQHFIKTGSGFGGCNAALVFSKTTI
jgi:3-oxoacyl-[acyl-carrier-protein] synthase-1